MVPEPEQDELPGKVLGPLQPPMSADGSLRIALVAPPWYPVPPSGYGGIELVVHLLAEGLQARGHLVTVFGRQGSRGSFQSIAIAPSSWEQDLGARNQVSREVLYLDRTYELIRRRAFDVVHDHTGFPGILMCAALRLPAATVVTLHGDLTEAEAEFLAAVDQRVALVGITASQQAQVASVRWHGMVHNAVDSSQLVVGTEKEPYLVQLARISPQKGQHLAIEVARQAGRPLVLAGKVDPGDAAYFREKIEPNLGENVRWVEDVAGCEKAELLAAATALVFPLQWPEPFGLAMVEAMASGTPVVALRRGSAPELIEIGVTGYLADGIDEMAACVQKATEIDPHACAERAREQFSSARMAEGYEAVYRSALHRAWNAPR